MLDFYFFEGRGVTERDGIKGENEALYRKYILRLEIFCRMEISLRLILRISLPMGRGRKKGCGNRSVD